MGLRDYITDMNIYSSLESVSDRCTVQLFIPYSEADYATIPALEASLNVQVKINDVETLPFYGIVKEREVEKSPGGYRATLHLYDKASVLINTPLRSALRPSAGLLVGSGGPGPAYYSPQSVVDQAQTAIGSAASLVWNPDNYQFKETVSFDSDSASVLRQLLEFHAPTEIQKPVIYADGSSSGRVNIDIVDLWKARITDSQQLDVDDRRDESASVGEIRLPEIYKLVVIGAATPPSPWKTKEPEVTTTTTLDYAANLKTVVRTEVTFDSIGRVGTNTVVSSAGKITGGSVAEIQREITDYTYTAYSNRLETEIYSLRIPVLVGDILYYRLKQTVSTKYAYDSKSRMKTKDATTREYDTNGGEILSKAKKSVTTYTELAKGITRRKEDSYTANIDTTTGAMSEKDPLKLKTSVSEVFYGDPPEASLEPFGAAAKTSVKKREVVIGTNVSAEIIEFSNPHLLTDTDFDRVVQRVRESDKAHRLDISLSLVGTPSVRKGGRYSILDPRPGKTGTLPFIALTVTHALTIGLSYTTTVQGVCYETD